MCDKGFSGNATLGYVEGGYKECDENDNIENCEYHDSSVLLQTCYSCKVGYAVSSDGLSCVAFDDDRNCRK